MLVSGDVEWWWRLNRREEGEIKIKGVVRISKEKLNITEKEVENRMRWMCCSWCFKKQDVAVLLGKVGRVLVRISGLSFLS